MSLFTDGVTAAVERALTGVAQRQRVTADNIANVDTPGFRASRVEFEADLARAIEAGRPETAAPSVVADGAAGGEDGNNVSLDRETATLVKSGLEYDALVAALNYKLNVLRTAIDAR